MQKNKAFTLIELSIVIVIIGLIVAGVVGGQSLVRQASMRGVLTELQSYERATHTFVLAYNALPGDLESAYSYWGSACGANSVGASGSCNGNGDKEVAFATGGVSSAPVEDVLFWKHLQLAEIINGSYTGKIASSGSNRYAVGENVPGLPMSTGISMYKYQPTTCSTSNTYFRGCGNLFKVGKVFSDEGYGVGAFLTPAEARSLDLKVDDGLVNKGRLIGYNGYKRSGVCHSGGAPNEAYDLDNSGVACAIAYWYDGGI